MTKFARQVSGSWCDPRESAALADLDTQYHPDWVSARKSAGEWFQSVSDVTYASLLTPSPLPQPVVMNNEKFGAFLSGLLDPDPVVGRSKLRQILEACAARAGTAASDYRTRDFKDWFYTSLNFDKARVTIYLDDLVTSTIITNNQRNAVIAAWPTA